MVHWELSHKHPTTSFGKIVKRHISAADAENVDNMVSAYEALYKGKFKSPSELRESFTKDGQPLFTTQQAASVFKKIQKQTKGGERVESILNSSISKGVDMAAGISEPEPPNLAVQGVIKSIQVVIRMVIPFVFILDTLEKTPLFGDLVGAALDITAATLPVIASNIQTFTPAIVGLIPLPLAGTVGIFLGWLFSLWFLWLAAVIGLSRKDFAAALESTAGMIPIIGPALMRGVKAAETVGTKFYNRADKISESISAAYGSLMGAVDTVTKSVNSFGPLPTTVPSASLVQKVAKDAVSTLSAPPAKEEPVTTSDTPPSSTEPKKSFLPTKIRRTRGGKRFSTSKQSIPKCQKTRRNRYVRS